MIAVTDQLMKACAIQRTLLSEELRCWSSQSFLSTRDHERSRRSLSKCPEVHLFWGFEMTQPATVFATDLWWWIQCKESLNMLGLVCLKMSVFSSLDLRQVFASTTWHIAMPTQVRSIRRWKQNPANRASGEFKAGDALRSIWPITHLTACWRSPILLSCLRVLFVLNIPSQAWGGTQAGQKKIFGHPWLQSWWCLQTRWNLPIWQHAGDCQCWDLSLQGISVLMITGAQFSMRQSLVRGGCCSFGWVKALLSQA